MQVTKIVITGGPCGGKTTAMSWIQREYERKGYKVLFIPETATELITGGVAPWTCGSNLDFQKCQVGLQREKEEVFARAAGSMGDEKVLIVCDRGVADNKAYMTGEEYAAVMEFLETNEVAERDQYDAVFHLVTAAKGAQEAYTLSNNGARTETPEQAAEVDDRIISAWTGHPHLRVIDNSTGFKGKLRRLMAEISAFLGEPEPLEIERRFLVERPDVDALDALPNCTRVDIIQTYLNCPEGMEVRLRQRGRDGNYLYYRTEKRRISDTTRTETERRISQQEYLALLMEADPQRRPIRKTRLCLTENNRYYEIDVYPEWKNQAILELEVKKEKERIKLPEHIKIMREITGEEAYTNYAMAMEMPEEE